MSNSIQNFVKSIALIPQSFTTAGVSNCSPVDLINSAGGEVVLGFVMFSGTRTGGDVVVQDFQMSKVFDFSTDTITLDSTAMEHFIPQNINSSVTALEQTRIQQSSAIRKIGIHLPKNSNEYRYGRVRIFGTAPNILLAAFYEFLATEKPI